MEVIYKRYIPKEQAYFHHIRPAKTATVLSRVICNIRGVANVLPLLRIKMTKISGKYLSGLKVQSTHLDSGAVITTVAPKDNNGDGSSFSPTDTVAMALASCMLTICGILAHRNNHSLEGADYEIEKIMQSNPRRIGKLILKMNLPLSIPEESRSSYEEALRNCPVHHSLHPEIELDLTINFK